MEDKEYTSLNYEEALKEYIEKKRQEFFDIVRKKALHDLIQRYEISGYQDNEILKQIAFHKIAAAEIIQDVQRYLELVERNSRIFAKTFNDLDGSEILAKIKGSQLFKTNDETLSLLSFQIAQFDALFEQYKKFMENKDFDAFMFLIEKATNFTEEERLEAYKMMAKDSCLVRERKPKNVQQSQYNKPEKTNEEESKEVEKVDVRSKAYEFFQRNIRFIENDNEQTIQRRVSLSGLTEHLNTPDCDGIVLGEKIGIVMYAIKESLDLYEKAISEEDGFSIELYSQDIIEKLEIGEEIVRQFEMKESKENMLPNVIFLKDNREDPLIYYDIEDYTPSDKLRLYQKISELQDPGIDKSSGVVKMNSRDAHNIYYKESGGVGILYTRLPNNVVLIIGSSKDSSGIYKIGQTRDESYYSKIEELISMASTDKKDLLKREKTVTDEIANKLVGNEKDRGAK